MPAFGNRLKPTTGTSARAATNSSPAALTVVFGWAIARFRICR